MLFQRLAKNRKWNDFEQTLLLQSMLTGNTQVAFSALSVIDSGNYLMVKKGILKMCELVPEAYRHARKFEKKFAYQLSTLFIRS